MQVEPAPRCSSLFGSLRLPDWRPSATPKNCMCLSVTCADGQLRTKSVCFYVPNQECTLSTHGMVVSHHATSRPQQARPDLQTRSKCIQQISFHLQGLHRCATGICAGLGVLAEISKTLQMRADAAAAPKTPKVPQAPPAPAVVRSGQPAGPQSRRGGSHPGRTRPEALSSWRPTRFRVLGFRLKSGPPSLPNSAGASAQSAEQLAALAMSAWGPAGNSQNLLDASCFLLPCLPVSRDSKP